MHRFFLCVAILFLTSAANAQEPATQPAEFTVFDNLHCADKPDLVSEGLKHCNIIYAGYVWKGAEKSPDYGKLPDETIYKKAVQTYSKLDGPVVLDFETLMLSGKPELVEAHFKLFMTLTQWTHEAAPGHIVGYYGHGLFPEQPGKEYTEQAKQLADAVDAFFPSMYTFTEDKNGWKKKADRLLQDAHRIAPGKPVYFYLWPLFHTGKHLPLSGELWSYELTTSKEIGANGVVLWSGKDPAWDANAPWWTATQSFIKSR